MEKGVIVKMKGVGVTTRQESIACFFSQNSIFDCSLTLSNYLHSQEKYNYKIQIFIWIRDDIEYVWYTIKAMVRVFFYTCLTLIF